MKAARRDAILLFVLLLTVIFLVSCAPLPNSAGALALFGRAYL